MGLLFKFLFLNIVTVTETHRYILLGIWGILVLLGLWSVYSSAWKSWARVAWTLLIVLVPIVGLFLYVVACLLTAEWELLKQMGFFSRSKKQVVKSIQSLET